jgi:hypothetical protein
MGPAGPPKLMKSGSRSATTVPRSTALPFVISTEAQRSGEICGPFLEMFFDREVMGQRAHPRVMKNGSCSATTLPGSPALPPCHPDRSAAQWRDLRFSDSCLEMFFDRAKQGPAAKRRR